MLSIETTMLRGSEMYLSSSQCFSKVERWDMLRMFSTEVFIALMLPFLFLIEKFIFCTFIWKSLVYAIQINSTKDIHTQAATMNVAEILMKHLHG